MTHYILPAALVALDIALTVVLYKDIRYLINVMNIND